MPCLYCAKPTLRVSPLPPSWLDTSTKSATSAPGASVAMLAARNCRAAASAIAGLLTAPGAAMPLPHMRSGTSVSRSYITFQFRLWIDPQPIDR